jgi:uncharacterized membrane protein YcgQ (UPF0703/DUF1980 family)
LTATGVANETFAVTGSGAAGNLSTKNVQSAQALSSVTGLSLGNSTNGGLSSNYNPIATSGSSVNVTPAQLNINVADSRMFVTQTPDASTVLNQGVSYSGTYTTGFAPTDTVASALSSNPSLSLQTYGSVTNTSHPNTYSNTLGLVTIPTANDGNYIITVNKGALIVDPAGMLIVTIPSLSSPVSYGTTTATNVGGLLDPSTITAKYFTASNGYISTLTVTPSNLIAGQYTAIDSTGASVNFLVNVTQPSLSTSQHLKVGNYVFGTNNITTPSNANFTSSGVNGGTLSINQAQLNVSGIAAADKVYDGTVSATINTTNAVFSGLVSGDIVTLASTGTFPDKNVALNKAVALSNTYGGSDLSNYYFGTQTQTSTIANITAITSNEINVKPHISPFVNPVSPKAPTSSSQSGGSSSRIASQQVMAEVVKPQALKKQCSVENPEACDCQNTLLSEVTLCVLPLDNSDTEQVADDASLKVSKQ